MPHPFFLTTPSSVIATRKTEGNYQQIAQNVYTLQQEYNNSLLQTLQPMLWCYGMYWDNVISENKELFSFNAILLQLNEVLNIPKNV